MPHSIDKPHQAANALGGLPPQSWLVAVSAAPFFQRTLVLALTAASAGMPGTSQAGVQNTEILAPVTAIAMTNGDAELVINELGNKTVRTHRSVVVRGPLVVVAPPATRVKLRIGAN